MTDTLKQVVTYSTTLGLVVERERKREGEGIGSGGGSDVVGLLIT